MPHTLERSTNSKTRALTGALTHYARDTSPTARSAVCRSRAARQLGNMGESDYEEADDFDDEGAAVRISLISAPTHPTLRHRASLPLQALAEEDDDRPAAKMQKVAPPQQAYRGPLAHQVPPPPLCHGA